MFEVQGSYSWPSDCDGTREKHGSSRTSMINNGEDGVFPSYIWKPCDKVHGNLLKGKSVFWGSDMIERDSRSMSKILVLLTYRISSDVIGNPGFHPFPFYAFLCFPVRLIPSR